MNDDPKRPLRVLSSAALGTEKWAVSSITDELKRSLAGVSAAALATEMWAAPSISDELKRSLAGISSAAMATEKWAVPSISEELKRSLAAMDTAAMATEKWAVPSISEELKRSFEQTSLLSKNISAALDGIHTHTDAIGLPSIAMDYDTFAPMELPPMELPPNPILETNRQLADLTDTVTQLVSVERQQAELTQAICNTSNLALKNSIESGEEAKTATRVARRTIVVTIIIAALSIIYTSYNNHREGVATDSRHQEEMRVFREISNQLKGLAK